MGTARELIWFGTPWHWVVHGLGLGLSPRGFDSARATRLLAVSEALGRRFDDCFHGLVSALLRLILAFRKESRLCDRLAWFPDPLEHARACTLVVDVLIALELPHDSLRRSLDAALARLSALPAESDRERYEIAHLIGKLLLTLGRSHWLDSPHVTPAIASAFRLLDGIESFFHRSRAAAILLTILGAIGKSSAARKPLANQLRLLDRAFAQQPNDRPDGVHVGLDYRLFPLLLTLTAAGALGGGDYLGWVEIARAELARLTARSRASQTLFYVSTLRSLGLFERYVPDPLALLRDTAERYLDHTDGCQADDYLRATYLVHLSRQLGCAEALSPRVSQILADSVATIPGSTRFRENPYASGYLVIAYVLSTDRELDLAAAVATVADDSPIQRARLGLALVDAALNLRPVS